jgi:crotonobetainyl-CoA:carnitine CoA-transferase CaiB-like acyl-CoA transferase
VSIAVGSEEEWESLKRIIADPALDDDEFRGPLERWHAQDRLDAIIERWTREREPGDVVEALQGAGIAAMQVHTSASIAGDPHVREREVLHRVDHPVIGERLVVGPPWRFSGDEVSVRRAAPLIGEHNDYVLRDLLHLSPEEIERLERADVLN